MTGRVRTQARVLKPKTRSAIRVPRLPLWLVELRRRRSERAGRINHCFRTEDFPAPSGQSSQTPPPRSDHGGSGTTDRSVHIGHRPVSCPGSPLLSTGLETVGLDMVGSDPGSVTVLGARCGVREGSRRC